MMKCQSSPSSNKQKGEPMIGSPFTCRSDWIRTSDPHHPKVVRYPGCATLRHSTYKINFLRAKNQYAITITLQFVAGFPPKQKRFCCSQDLRSRSRISLISSFTSASTCFKYTCWSIVSSFICCWIRARICSSLNFCS